MVAKIRENFAEYVLAIDSFHKASVPPGFFQVFADLQKFNGCSGQEIFYTLLKKIFDRPEREIDEILPRYLSDLWASKFLGKWGI